MKIIPTSISGLVVIEPIVFEDSRGYFFESFNEKKLSDAGIHLRFVQDNQSKSSYGVIRGLHYQLSPHAQTKLVRVLQGAILDVAVDLRTKSATFGKTLGVELSAENKKQLLVPRGFAHGFSVLTETAVVMYKCDEYYTPQAERGIVFNDPALNIDWRIPAGKEIVSDRDRNFKPFNQAEMNF